jgi:hypothetical protein
MLRKRKNNSLKYLVLSCVQFVRHVLFEFKLKQLIEKKMRKKNE